MVDDVEAAAFWVAQPCGLRKPNAETWRFAFCAGLISDGAVAAAFIGTRADDVVVVAVAVAGTVDVRAAAGCPGSGLTKCGRPGLCFTALVLAE